MGKIAFLPVVLALLLVFGGGCLSKPSSSNNAPPQTFPASEITRNSLVGGWVIAPSETILLNEDGTFATYIAERPGATGAWSLQDERLTLNYDQDAALNTTYRLREEGGRLKFFNERLQKEEEWIGVQEGPLGEND